MYPFYILLVQEQIMYNSTMEHICVFFLYVTEMYIMYIKG